jgi:hypothetical protein
MSKFISKKFTKNCFQCQWRQELTRAQTLLALPENLLGLKRETPHSHIAWKQLSGPQSLAFISQSSVIKKKKVLLHEQHLVSVLENFFSSSFLTFWTSRLCLFLCSLLSILFSLVAYLRVVVELAQVNNSQILNWLEKLTQIFQTCNFPP